MFLEHQTDAAIVTAPFGKSEPETGQLCLGLFIPMVRHSCWNCIFGMENELCPLLVYDRSTFSQAPPLVAVTFGEGCQCVRWGPQPDKIEIREALHAPPSSPSPLQKGVSVSVGGQRHGSASAM